MMRRLAQALVAVMLFLILVAELQVQEDAARQREFEATFAAVAR